jgi:hypothetical protein
LDLRGRKWQEAGKDYIMRSFIICVSSNVIRVFKSKGMRWAETRSTQEGYEKYIHNFFFFFQIGVRQDYLFRLHFFHEVYE